MWLRTAHFLPPPFAPLPKKLLIVLKTLVRKLVEELGGGGGGGGVVDGLFPAPLPPLLPPSDFGAAIGGCQVVPALVDCTEFIVEA